MKKSKKQTKRIKSLTILISVVMPLFLLFFLSACGNEPITQVHFKELQTGTKGLTMNFVKGMPPSENYEKTDFGVGLEIRNQGAWDVTNAKIRIGGFDPSSLNLKLDESEDDDAETNDLLVTYPMLEGKSAMSTIGG